MINQLFLIPGETYRALEPSEVTATYSDMLELGIAKPPYEDFVIGLPLWSIFTVFDKLTGAKALIAKDDEFGQTPVYYHYKAGKFTRLELTKQYPHIPDFVTWLQQGKCAIHGTELEFYREGTEKCAQYLLQALIVLLATRNATKTTIHNKLAKFGVGKAKAEYTTTITLGQITESHVASGDVTGRTLRPHLRRGHIRTQHYGPNNAFLKKVFIEPTFVNADENFINSRKAYNVTGAQP